VILIFWLQVSVLFPPNSGKPDCHWFTATPDPNISVFKPFIFTPYVEISNYTVSPTIDNDPAKVSTANVYCSVATRAQGGGAEKPAKNYRFSNLQEKQLTFIVKRVSIEVKFGSNLALGRVNRTPKAFFFFEMCICSLLSERTSKMIDSGSGGGMNVAEFRISKMGSEASSKNTVAQIKTIMKKVIL